MRASVRFLLRLAPALVGALVAVAGAAAVREGMVLIPAGVYTPLQRSARDLPSVPVAAFWLDERPVTNADFLAFVTAQPKWRRSQVSRLFADSSYLEHWAGDLDPGAGAPPGAPVVRVSWFAARAYARWAGKRLPATAEWERAAAAGYTRPDGANDEAHNRDLCAWLARPVPPVLPDAATARPNFLGVRGLHGLAWEWVDDFNTALVTGESRADSGLERDLFCGAGSLGAKDTANYAAFMRAALRSSLKANNTTSSLGFRCARDAATFAAEPAKPKDDDCCKHAQPAGAFTKESLYQLDATFTDDAGQPFALGSLRGRPVVLNMFFASCGYACPLTVTDLLAIQGRLPPELRDRAVFVLVSFDVARDTAAALAQYRASRGLDQHWILLRGTDDSVRELAALLGVKYKREADGTFSHSNVVTILNREGEIVHQRLGLKGGLDEAAAALATTLR